MRGLGIIFAASAIVAACGSEGDTAEPAGTPEVEAAEGSDDEEQAEEAGDESDEAGDVSSAGGAQSDDSGDDEAGGADAEGAPEAPRPFEAVTLPAGINQLPVLGGVQFELPATAKALVDPNCLLIFEPFVTSLGARESGMFIGELGTSRRDTTLTPLETIEQWSSLVEAQLGSAPEPTGETRELFGTTLTGFEFDGVPFFGEGEQVPDLFGCGTQDAPAFLEIFPAGFEEWFVGERNGALLVVTSGGNTAEFAERNHEFRNDLLDTIVEIDPPEPITQPVTEGAAAPLAIDAPVLGDQVRNYTFSALGGVRFDADSTHDVYAYGDHVIIDPAGPGSNVDTNWVRLSLLTQDPNGGPVGTVDDVLAAIRSVPELSVQPNGNTVELFGRELIGYNVNLESNPSFAQVVPTPQIRLLDGSRRGAIPFASFTPQRAQVYLADTPAGVLYVSYDVNPYADPPPTLDAFATLLDTAELTGPGLNSPLPDGTVYGGSGPVPEPAEIVDGGPPGLFLAFAPTPDGRHQLPNFGIPISADTSGWFMQPNQPGAVVLVGSGISTGPGARGVVMLAGLEPAIIPQAGGPTRAGDPVDLSDIEAFLADPPDNLVVSNVVETEVGGLEAFRFDVRVADGVSCAQDDPCEYAFEAAWNWAATVSINAENEHRIWWMPDHPAGPAMIHVSDIDPDFIEIGTRFVDSIEREG